MLAEILGTYLLMIGGDPGEGQKIFHLLRRARLRDVELRGSVKVLTGGHPCRHGAGRSGRERPGPRRDGVQNSEGARPGGGLRLAHALPGVRLEGERLLKLRLVD